MRQVIDFGIPFIREDANVARSKFEDKGLYASKERSGFRKRCSPQLASICVYVRERNEETEFPLGEEKLQGLFHLAPSFRGDEGETRGPGREKHTPMYPAALI